MENKNEIQDRLELSPKEKSWVEFKNGFNAIIVIQIILIIIRQTSSSYVPSVLTILMMLATVGYVGYYSFLFLGDKKHAILASISGFLSLSVIGMLLTYHVVKNDYYKSINKPYSKRFLIYGLILTPIIVIGIISSTILTTLNGKRLSSITNVDNSENLNWVNVVSPEGKFSLDLPRNSSFNPDDPTSDIIGYSWSAKDQNESIAYIVKYEDHQSTFEKLKISKNLTSEENNKILKSFSDAEVKKFSVTNFSSQFINIKGYPSIKYTGSINKNGDNLNIEENIILIDKSFYYVVAIYKTGYKNEIDRILNSLIVK